jgi:3-phenylpropionate/trans-cinnamate dioxygenase ferredoxin subunit
MARHIVGAVDEIPPGGRKLVEADGKKIVVFNLGGEFFALLDRCPHQGSALSGGILCGLTLSEEPGRYHFSRAGEMLRCPWHNWEFDIRTGKSWFDPRRTKVRAFPAHVETGAALASDPRRAQAQGGDVVDQTEPATPSMSVDGIAVEGPYRAETFPVKIEADYVVVEV